MNLKKCKALRRIARAHSLKMPARQLLAKEHTVFIKGKPYKAVQTVNDPNMTRGVYRALKKGHLEITTDPLAG